MGHDKYKVQILHYTNPHLMWVLAENEGEQNSYRFEQIGIYGIVPLNVDMDYEGQVIMTRGEDWLPAVFVAMKKIFLDAKEVWFSVSFMDRTTSIFDDNVHKFGNLTIKMKDGTTISLLERLLEKSFVAEDVESFHKNLNTKLDYVNTLSVINNIKQSLKELKKPFNLLERILNDQLSVFLKTVELEEIHPRDLDVSQRNDHAEVVLRKQIHDLNACKDIDEESAGRANNMKSVKPPSSMNSTLMKKLNLIKAQGMSLNIKEDSKNAIDENYNQNLLDNNVSKHVESQKTNKTTQYNKGKKAKVKDSQHKKLMAFGPPGLSHYVMTEVQPEEYEVKSKVNTKEEIIETETVDDVKHDMFEKTDSEVNIKISNLKILESKSKQDSVEKNYNIASENIDTKSSTEDVKHNDNPKPVKLASSSLYLKMKILKEKTARLNDSSSTADTDSALKQGDDSDTESITDLVNKLDVSNDSIKKEVTMEPEIVKNEKHNVNPFKNLDGSKSVFVEKLVNPTLMVHTKKNNKIQPVTNMRDLPFGTDIHVVLRNMSVRKPMRMQTVSWPTILRGHSLFLVSPHDSGKTMGYLPAVCRLVSDSRKTANGLSTARLTCIIVCATSNSVRNVEELCKMFLHEARIFACYIGMRDIDITTSILNGCDILISTPCLLVRLIRDNLGLDLRDLTTFVIDDCERISDVYQNELKFCLFKVKEMLKARVNKEVKVQYVVASRIWCDFMSSLAKKAPDSIVCIGAFQECVLYSEVDTTIEFLKKENKIDSVVRFLDNIDKSKKTVIACRSDEEVHLIADALTNLKYVVFACDGTMTVHDLYNIDLALGEYNEPVTGPILVCCDENLVHLNLTDAHYLIHFSLPEMFSMFCKRFAVLIDKYPSIFDGQDSKVKIKIFLETSNVEQLPKILHFIKRCTSNVPSVLDEISTAVMSEKDLKKAQMFVPLCNNLLSLGKCPDIWNCKQRHAIFQEFDQPIPWIPREGMVTFKILHYHTAVHYSARMLSCTTNNGVRKYPQTYSMLSIKLGMYYSKEINRKLHGVAKPGDICAVSLKQNFFARCQVMKILKYTQNNLPSLMLINLIDEEKYEMARDTCLYHLPDDLEKIESQAVRVILDNLAPQDRDIAYSKLAEEKLKNITEKNEDLYMRGHISLVIGNCIFVETLEACQDLSSLNETVVKNNFKNELLDGFAIDNPDHINCLLKLGENLEFMRKNPTQVQPNEVPKPLKVLPKASWAHLESDIHVPVYYLYAKSPDVFFVQHVKFRDCLDILLKDIAKYVTENPQPVEDVQPGDIVLAEFPDSSEYERARIDRVSDDGKIKCFFVDLGDWREVAKDKLLTITDKMITQLPFQAIECRLVGIKPLGDEWSEFSTNWLVDQFYDSTTNLKYLFAKRYTKEKATFTEGGKYGITLMDTYANDVCINTLMLEANLAEENDEIDFLSRENLATVQRDTIEETDSHDDNVALEEANTNKSAEQNTSSNTDGIDKSDVTTNGILLPNKENQLALNNSFQNTQDSFSNTSVSSEENVRSDQQKIMNLFRNPIRSVPLVDEDDVDDDKWDTFNPVSMLTNSNQGASPVLETTNEPKIVPLAIESITEKTENQAQKSKIKNTDLNKQQNVKSLSENKHLLNNKSILKSDANDTSKENKQKYRNNLPWFVQESGNTIFLYEEVSTNNGKKLELTWSQDNNIVTIQIKVVTEKYVLNIKDKEIQFYTNLINNDGFEFELYGVVDTEKSTHVNKGTYVEVNLAKVMCKKWLKLMKGGIKKYAINVDNNISSISAVNVSKRELNEEELDVSFKTSCITYSPNVNNAVGNTTNLRFKQEIETLRKPKIVWRQNKYKVTIKILLITEKYTLKVEERRLKFNSNANDEEYGFEIELYGVVEVDKSTHSNKGQYIQVNLVKVLPKNWLTLSKGSIKKWIVYDVDNIDVSSDDEKDSTDDIANLQKCLNLDHESDSEDDFIDDTNFPYKKY